ncbi:MAG: sigma-E processing peptidase SpoIIGA [Clostridia bacterium]|nr:sigma-E processing peptidase SpoIIGA [Clostridia bacterium]
MTIYLDIVFLENFLLNFIIIFSTSLITKSKTTLFKMVITSAFGSLFSISEYIYFGIKENEKFIFKFVLSIVMINMTFGFKKKKLLFNLVVFYLVSLSFGGLSFATLFFINSEKIIIKNDMFLGISLLESIVIASIICFVLILVLIVCLKIYEKKKSELIEIEIINNGKTHKVMALYDTGNLLKEPITQKDVIIVEKGELYDICDNNFLDSIKDILNGKWIGDENSNYKFCLIPFSSLGNENGILIGFKPDYIKVNIEEEIFKNEVFVGIYDGKLTNNNLYTSLIGLNILNREESINELI